MRRILTVLTALVGLILIVVGLWGAPPPGPVTSPVVSEPKIPGAAGIFILGIVVLFLTGVVYCVVPERKSS